MDIFGIYCGWKCAVVGWVSFVAVVELDGESLKVRMGEVDGCSLGANLGLTLPGFLFLILFLFSFCLVKFSLTIFMTDCLSLC